MQTSVYDCPYRIWSCTDLLACINLYELIASFNQICAHQQTFQRAQYDKKGHIVLDGASRVAVIGGVERLMAACENCGFREAEGKIGVSLVYFRQEPHLFTALAAYSSIAVELRNIKEAVLANARDQSFVVLTGRGAEYLNTDSILGDSVPIAFPSARPDIIEAGKCIGLQCNTAAVFHLMRVVEWGLRSLGASLGIRNLKSRNKKSGKVTLTPLAYSEWEKIIDQIRRHVDAKIQTAKRGTVKQSLQEFYYPALSEVKAIKDAWRNHVMHTRAEYDDADSEAVLSHVKRLMSTLATRISEV